MGTTGVITGQRAAIRKVLTPKMAKLSLSSVALRDGIVHGLPCHRCVYVCVCVCVCVTVGDLICVQCNVNEKEKEKSERRREGVRVNLVMVVRIASMPLW